MAKTKISEYDSTAANNTDIDGINIAEGMAPSNVNNALREQMAHLKDGLGAGTPVFLDQTNNRVGIGTTSPDGNLDITGSGNTDVYKNTGNNSGDNSRIFFGDTADIDVGYLAYDHGTNAMIFGVNAGNRLRIDSSGNVGIGNSSPSEFLTIGDSTADGASRIQFFSTTNGVNTIHFGDGASSAAFRGYIQYAHNNDSLTFGTSAANRLIISSGGVVTIPNQPFGIGSTNVSETAIGKIQINTNRVSRGGMTVDSSTDRITVPVDGAYLIGYSHLSENASTQVAIRVNNVQISGSLTQGVAGNITIANTIVKNLSANDYVEFFCVAGKVHGNDAYNSMYVILLG